MDGKRIQSKAIVLVPDGQGRGVKAGDPVKVRILSNGASVEVMGLANGNAWVGQSVTVRAATGTTHTGILVSEGIVEVKI